MSYKIKKINHDRVERRDYTKVSSELPLPNLVEIQTDTYKWWQEHGIQEVFDEIFPIVSANGNATLSMDNWEFRTPRNTIKQAKEESKMYDAPIYANLSLTITLNDEAIDKTSEEFKGKKSLDDIIKTWLQDKLDNKTVTLKKKTGKLYYYESKIRGRKDPDIIELEVLSDDKKQVVVKATVYKKGEVFMGDFPLMTDSGTFIINGSQKVIVSQLVRSPGSYFKKEINPKNGEMIYSADIIPSRGTWLEFSSDIKEVEEKNKQTFYVKIDKARKVTATSLLTTLGLKPKEVMDLFDNSDLLKATYAQDSLVGDDFTDWENSTQEIYKKIRQGETATAEGASKYIYSLFFDRRKYDLTKAGRFKLGQKLAIKNRILGRTLAEDIKDAKGKVLIPKDTLVTKDKWQEVADALDKKGTMMYKLNLSDEIAGPHEVQRVLVYKDNDLKKDTIALIGNTTESEDLFLNVPDIIATINYADGLQYNIGNTDDIDHLGNRRVRTVGELLPNQFRIGMIRIDKNVKEKLATTQLLKVKPSTIINNKPLTAVIGEFFNLSQLSQFMDQENPLSELTNKRRLTALGPGGLSRDRAGLDVRDVHNSHYGRICPIETPEGPNIGLINNLASYAKVNEYGFLTTPYRKVNNGVIDDNDIKYMTADEENNYIISQANVRLDKNMKMLDKTVIARFHGDDIIAEVKDVDYIDVSPKQIFSIASACVPFLQNDDANRALMGANMQRQAVPVIQPESAYVGTGLEFEIARDSGATIVAKEKGIVKYADSRVITVESKEGTHTYTLTDYERSNNGTAIWQRPIVRAGDKVDKGDIIADGPSTQDGELAIGQNMVVAFTTYNGYNYEDAVVMSERVTQDDRFTSIHIDEYTIERRNTRQGAEEITRDIPNISDAAKKYLDEDGIITVGAEVKKGDILVGKVTPKGQVQLSPEDKLLNAIFGEKSRNVKDNSIRVPNGGDGIVQSVKRFSKEDGYDLAPDILEIIKVYIVQKRKIQEGDKMSGRHGNKGVISRILPIEDMPHLEDGTPVDILLNPQGVPSRMNIGQLLEMHLGMAAKKLGVKISTPIFDGVSDEELNEIMKEAGMTDWGKVKLIDGATGEAFDKPIAVGVMYMLKLAHMVDDKIHARNVGPYSLITQQPLGGKAQNGGQRFGEMEVWALEAYGAAHTLREILTIKSDDIKGRVKTYEAIVRSKKIPEPGIPESFNVLTKEIMGLGFNMYMIDDHGTKMAISAYDNNEDYDEDEAELYQAGADDFMNPEEDGVEAVDNNDDATVEDDNSEQYETNVAND